MEQFQEVGILRFFDLFRAFLTQKLHISHKTYYTSFYSVFYGLHESVTSIVLFWVEKYPFFDLKTMFQDGFPAFSYSSMGVI
jgi:hypothetical protein